MDIIAGFGTLFGDPTLVALVVFAAIAGIFIGATPGLTTAAAIAMLVPLTFFMDPLPALAVLYVIGKSGRYGGSIAAILFNTPGTAAAAATSWDGYPMARAGKAGKALRISVTSSATADFLGDMVLIFGASVVVALTSGFGPPEFFALYVAAFLIISTIIGSSIIKGVISAAAGAMLAMVGVDAMEGSPRLDFGIPEFHAGITLIPVLVGMFVLAEIAVQLETASKNPNSGPPTKGARDTDDKLTLVEYIRLLPVIIRSSVIGAIIGLMPGLGSSVAAFAAYGVEKRRARNSEKWGTGVKEGIAAPEAGNNAVNGPEMVPTLALGVPGGTISAILMGVFLIHGITIGPNVLETSGKIVYGLFAAGLVGIAVYGLVGFFGAPLIGRLVAMVPIRLVYPYIFLTCFISAYSARTNVFDVLVMAGAGFIGYLMRKHGYSTAAFIIAFVLARGAEEAFRQSLLLSESGARIFLERPIALAFFFVATLMLGSRILQNRRVRARPRENSQTQIAN